MRNYQQARTHIDAASRAYAAETPRHLEELDMLNRALYVLEGQKTAVVGDALIAGATWSQIGNALNITKQAAQQRYGWLYKPARSATVSE